MISNTRKLSTRYSRLLGISADSRTAGVSRQSPKSFSSFGQHWSWTALTATGWHVAFHYSASPLLTSAASSGSCDQVGRTEVCIMGIPELMVLVMPLALVGFIVWRALGRRQ